MEMKNCVTCGAPATRWSGHVHTSIGHIIAGHCQRTGANYCLTGRDAINRDPSCASTNPHSCYGYKDIDTLELTQPQSIETLIQHAKDQEFMRRVDAEIYQTPEVYKNGGE